MSVSVGGTCGVVWYMVDPILVVAQGVAPVVGAVALRASPLEVCRVQHCPAAWEAVLLCGFAL